MNTQAITTANLNCPVTENIGTSGARGGRPEPRSGILRRLSAGLKSYLFPPPEGRIARVRGFHEINPYGEVPASDIW